jgi:hypothetical protein
MRPPRLDTALFMALCFFAGLEGTFIANALMKPDADPLNLAQGFQPLIAATLALITATLVYFSNMAKAWQDRDAKVLEQEGIAIAIDIELAEIVRETFFLAHHVEYAAAEIIGGNDPTDESWRDLYKRADVAMEYCRARMHLAHAEKVKELADKKNKVESLMNAARQTKSVADSLRATAKDLPTEKRISGIKIVCQALMRNCMNIARDFSSLRPEDWMTSYQNLLAGAGQQMELAGWLFPYERNQDAPAPAIGSIT